MLTARRVHADVVIIGAGFGGTLTALALRQLGRSVVLLERGRHPRFAIGESSTPLANLLLEELCTRYDLPRIAPLSKWGTWRRTYPDLPVGLKRGFSFFHHTPGHWFEDDDRHARQLLVAASPRDDIADTHWHRPSFDAFLAREAQDAGAELFDETELRGITFDGGLARIDAVRRTRSVHVTARFVVDASGPRGALHRLLGLDTRPMRWLPPTQALYTHFSDVARWEETESDQAGAPYPADDAAMHHVFPGGWMWILRFNNGVASAGVALTDQLARELRLDEGDPAWQRVLQRLPSVDAQFAGARTLLPFVHAPRVAFRSDVVCGAQWALLPSAAGVIDPLLSTGFPLTLLGVHRLVDALERTWTCGDRLAALGEYEAHTLAELDATEQLVAALYASMDDVELFKRLTLLYFAAASFSETARRLGRSEMARGFLLCGDPRFGPAARACTEGALARPQGLARQALIDAIDRAIEPFDVAGLGDRARRDWYPARAEDLLAARAKLGATEEEITTLLARCGFGVLSGSAECGRLGAD